MPNPPNNAQSNKAIPRDLSEALGFITLLFFLFQFSSQGQPHFGQITASSNNSFPQCEQYFINIPSFFSILPYLVEKNYKKHWVLPQCLYFTLFLFSFVSFL